MNMNKEIRAEIRILEKAKKKVERDEEATKRKSRLIVRKAKALFDRAVKNAARHRDRITKRIAILEGRLS